MGYRLKDSGISKGREFPNFRVKVYERVGKTIK